MRTPINEKSRATPKATRQESSNAIHDNRLLVTLRETGAMLGLSERTVWSLVNSGKLSRVKIGRSIRIPMDSIRQLIEGATS